MSSQTPRPAATDSEADSNPEPDTRDSSTDTDRLDRLEAENEQLRRDVSAARQSRHRRTMLGFAVIGLVSIAGALAIPGARTILLALGATGVFGALLTYSITPERFVSAAVGSDVFRPLSADRESIVAELGLSDARRYVPTDNPDDRVRLFVPQSAHTDLPDADALTETFLVDADTRGLSLRPAGHDLLESLERSAPTGALDAPRSAGVVCADAIVSDFELATDARADDDPGRVTVELAGIEYGSIDRFDHPIVSVLACAIAQAADNPVETEVVANPDGRPEAIVTCRWDHERAGDVGDRPAGDETADDAE